MQKIKTLLLKLLILIPDYLYLKIAFRIKMKERLDLKKPKTFNQKLQWLKLYNRNPLYTTMVDKIESKEYVGNIIGKNHVIKTLGVYNRFKDIDFDKLPTKFVIKCSHDSGSVIICRDKTTFDVKAAEKKINAKLKSNPYPVFREWPYKNVKPRILIEEYMEDKNQKSIVDYKFFCFNGIPRFLYVSEGLENHETANISFLNLDWSFSKYEREDFKQFNRLPKKPTNYSEMLDIARKLSKGNPFVRVDLYEINNNIYFSELTFFPWSGFRHFKKEEHDLEIGSMLDLNR